MLRRSIGNSKVLSPSERDVARHELLSSYRKKKPLILFKRGLGFLIHPVRALRYLREKRDLLRSGLFDEEYYLRNNEDVHLNAAEPLRHFLIHGYREERSPGPLFDTKFYLERYPDVRALRINPALHYYRTGRQEGRVAFPGTEKIQEGNEERRGNVIRDDIIRNLKLYKHPAHEITWEAEEIRSSGLFDEALYLSLYPAVKDYGVDPVVHYCLFGWNVGCRFSEKYDFEVYRKTYPDVDRASQNPLLHYIRKGKAEGRKLFLRDYSFPLKPETAGGKQDKFEQIWRYRRNRLNRGPAGVVVYSFNIEKDDWLFDLGLCFDWDYVCFVDQKSRASLEGVWEYRFADYFDLNPGKTAFYYKSHPHVYLKEYQKTIWIEPDILRSPVTREDFEKALQAPEPVIFLCGHGINRSYQDHALAEALSKEAPESHKLIQADSRILIRDNTCQEVSISSIKQWQLYSRRPYNHRFSVGNYLVDEKTEFSELIPAGDLLLTQRQVQPFEAEKAVLKEADYLFPEPCDWEALKKQFEAVSVKVVVPVYNALEDLKRCLSSIDDHARRPFLLVLADDGSGPETAQWLKEYAESKDHVVLMRNQTNLGYTRNVNQALKAATSDFSIVLNSDTIVSPFWIEKLLRCAYSEEKIGIIGPLSNAAGWQTVPDVDKVNPLPGLFSVQGVNSFLEEHSSSIFPKVDLVNGFCFGVKEEVFKEIGYFDEELFPRGYGEEDDFCLRARWAGFLCAVATDAYVFHAKSKSFGHRQRLELATESRAILDNKYGKNTLLEITESLRHNPLLRHYKKLISGLYELSEQKFSSIGEPVQILSSREAAQIFRGGKIAVYLHLFYVDMADFFLSCLQRIPFTFDLFISVCSDDSNEKMKLIFQDLPNVSRCVAKKVPNRGRDLAPLVLTFGRDLLSYDYALHLHSKKSSHDSRMGEKWLRWLTDSLLYNGSYIANILARLQDDETLGFVSAPIRPDLYSHYTWRNNKDVAETLLVAMNLDKALLGEELSFPAGSFFWFKPAALKSLFTSSLNLEDFPEEPIPVDGTAAHALERLVFLIGKSTGFRYLTCLPDDKALEPLPRPGDGLNEKFLGYLQVFARIREAVRQNKPFALIRYYDGEGAFYGLGTREKPYVDLRMSYYFGNFPYTGEDIDIIVSGIANSVSLADVIGTVPPEILQRARGFAEIEVGEDYERLPFLGKRLNKAIDCDGVWRILKADKLVKENCNDSSAFCSKDVHYELVYSGLLYELLEELDEVSLITSQPLKEVLEKRFCLKVNLMAIPPRAFDNESNEQTGHYPLVFKKILKELERDLSGKVFIVGAGPLGKIYCARIKENGGIALDMGAVLDSWGNFHSRPEHRQSADSFAIDPRLVLRESLPTGEGISRRLLDKYREVENAL